MYVTRRLSQYQADLKAAAEPPPEGPGSGFLVVLDVAGEMLGSLPFPQTRQLLLGHNSSSCCTGPVATGALCVCCCLLSIAAILSGTPVMPPSSVGTVKAPPDSVMLVPVVGQPLASGRYYVVRASGEHMGKVSLCSKEEDKKAGCFGSSVKDLQPCFFERGDVYRQVEVQRLPSGFTAVAVATDGIPPGFLRKKGWEVSTMAYPNYVLTDDAQGVDCALRRRMPDLGSLNIAERGSPPVVVGRWYVPFMFVRADHMFSKSGDGKISLSDQSERSMFYKMTMEQRWEQIYSREAESGNHRRSKPGEVAVTATVRRSTTLLDGSSVVPQEVGGAMWFRPAGAATGTVGLDMVVWERMMWELERGGWVMRGNGDEEKIERVEKRDDGLGQWHKFGCYVLVETFVLRRMDRSLALTCEFRHTDKIRAKWL